MLDNLKPLGDWVLLTDREKDKETKSGIQIVRNDPITESYIVVRTGPNVTRVKEGDIVTIPFLHNDENQGFPTKWEGHKIKFVKEKDILVKIVETRKSKIEKLGDEDHLIIKG